MEILHAISSVFTIVGIPALFTIVFYLQKKHVEVLQERIRFLEDRTPEKLASVLEAERKLFEAKLSTQENESRAALETERKKAGALSEDLEKLRASMEIMNKYWSGQDYRYEILRQQEERRD